MKLWKKILLALVALLLLAQLPLLYRRRQLANLRQAISELNNQRTPTPDPQFVDYKGVSHVHSNLGGHSTGTLPEVVRAAEKNGLSFVIMTEHPSAELDTALMTLSGVHRGVLFLGGNEIAASNGDRFLTTGPVPSGVQDGASSTEAVLSAAKSGNNLALVAYPNDYHSWDLRSFDGVEVYNLYTNSKRVKPLWMAMDGLWSLRSYGDLLFVRFFERPDNAMALFDRAIQNQNRKLVAVAGNDAHQNVGFGIADATGKKPLFLQLDPYERSFAVVRNHVLIPKDQLLNVVSLAEAIKAGHTYIGFDILGDPTGFMFAVEGNGERWIIGDELTYKDGLKLTVQAPVIADVKVFRNGEPYAEATQGKKVEFPVKNAGVFRVEVELPQLGPLVKGKPWIISNPIYIR